MPTIDATKSLAILLDALDGELSPESKTALAAQLELINPPGVKPGDLITADLFNHMLEDIENLMARVATLEGAGGGPIITGISPSGAAILTNTTMSILGSGFDIEPNRNVVQLGEAIITQFQAGSSETRLTFSVPDLFSGLPKSVNAFVERGGKRSNAFAVNLAQAPRAQTGEFDITIFAAPTQVLAAGQVLTFQFDVFADIGLHDEMRYQLDANNAQGANQAAWRATASFSPPAPHAIEPGDTVRVTMTVTAPAGATRADLVFKVLGIDGQAVGVSQVLNWSVGGTLAPSSPLAKLDFAIAGGAAPFTIVDNVTVDGVQYDKGINVKVGTNAIINFTLTDLRTGQPSQGTTADYNYTTEISPSSAGWTIMNAPTPASHSGVAAGAPRTFSMRLRNDSGAVAATTLFRMYANQTKASGQLAAFKSYAVIPLILVA